MNLAQRIKLRLSKLGKTERGASLEAGLSDSFLRNIRQNKSSSPRIDTLEKIADALETTPGWLMTGEGEEERSIDIADLAGFPPHENTGGAAEQALVPAQFGQSAHETIQESLRKNAKPPQNYDGFHESNDEPYAAITPSPYPLYGIAPKKKPPQSAAANPAAANTASNTASNAAPNAVIGKKFALSGRHLPVYGQAVGGIDGEFPINGSTLYSILCPPQLSEISGAYAVSISGDSMYPRYEDGEIAFVDPTRRVKKGDYVIAQIMAEEGEPPLAYVKKFIRHNAGGLVLEQFNPVKELHFPHERVVSVHYIALAGTAPV